MSKLECRKCGYEGTDWRCPICDELVIAKPKNPTVFNHITESEEALAEKLVYVSLEEYYKPFSANKCGNGIVIREEWRSTITGGTWKTRAEAIAATIEELKKEYKG